MYCCTVVSLEKLLSKENSQRAKKHSLPGPQPPNSGPQHCHAAVSEPLLAVCSHQILQNFRRRFAPPNFWDLRTVTLHGNLRFWDLRTVTLWIPSPSQKKGRGGLWCGEVAGGGESGQAVRELARWWKNVQDGPKRSRVLFSCCSPRDS